jgi:hypothetical protein
MTSLGEVARMALALPETEEVPAWEVGLDQQAAFSDQD